MDNFLDWLTGLLEKIGNWAEKKTEPERKIRRQNK